MYACVFILGVSCNTFVCGTQQNTSPQDIPSCFCVFVLPLHCYHSCRKCLFFSSIISHILHTNVYIYIIIYTWITISHWPLIWIKMWVATSWTHSYWRLKMVARGLALDWHAGWKHIHKHGSSSCRLHDCISLVPSPTIAKMADFCWQPCCKGKEDKARHQSLQHLRWECTTTLLAHSSTH